MLCLWLLKTNSQNKVAAKNTFRSGSVETMQKNRRARGLLANFHNYQVVQKVCTTHILLNCGKIIMAFIEYTDLC